MNLAQIKQHIQTRNLLPVYIFTGEEIGVMNIYIKQMEKASGKRIARMDSFLDIFSNVSKKSLMQESHIYVVRDDVEVQKNEKIWEILKNANWSDIVILLFTALDKRIKFYKQFEDKICVFEHLEENVLIRYIQKEIPLSEKYCKKLIEVCEQDYSRIMLEIEKMKQYRVGMDYTDDDKVYNHVLQELLDSGLIYQPAKDAIFDWSDAVMGRKKQLSFDLMEECFACGEAVMVMLSVLYNNMRQTLQVQTAGSRDVSKITGLTGWQIQCGKKFVGKYTEKQLLDAMQIIRKMEKGIKTGEVEEKMVIQYILINIL